MEERIDSLEGDGHLHRGGDADGARVRETVHAGSQARGPLRTRSKGATQRPPPCPLLRASGSVAQSSWLRHIREK